VTSAILTACASDSKNPNGSQSESSSTSSANEERIKELEAMIESILTNKELSDSESSKEIENLKSEIENLKSQSSKQTEAQTDPAQTTERTFTYTIVNGLATITSISSSEKNIVIPYTIDDYKVYSIASEALSSKTVESIIISSGIEKIDWFAFKNCPNLVSVTIPDTVNSIGYGAFDNASKSFVIRCSRDSFAHRYAQSYGITYDIS
jgi:hypothetical protein